ncbi:winged helix-turn-helix domain-containing protein [Hyphomicrobium sp.]|uniref:winged helix-turn-helix domain-containing protein n=1 Tax=Hyphomicrobium sp. TaxID=82 RepID=UPI0025BD5466|nr:winged helix-turn-helix domain-containing protein [Hyphomicrobium sp.]MCC7253886.1 winged helix-turn-helix domain-containing protein [Hyphomicrobium sp.]
MPTAIVSIGGIEVDPTSRIVHSSGRLVRLGEVEFKLLALLVSAPGAVFSRERLVEEFWPDRIFLDVRTVDQKIRRLRSALIRGVAPDPIRSVRGKGYKFSETYATDYATWLDKGRKRLHLEEIARRRKRVKDRPEQS